MAGATAAWRLLLILILRGHGRCGWGTRKLLLRRLLQQVLLLLLPRISPPCCSSRVSRRRLVAWGVVVLRRDRKHSPSTTTWAGDRPACAERGRWRQRMRGSIARRGGRRGWRQRRLPPRRLARNRGDEEAGRRGIPRVQAPKAEGGGGGAYRWGTADLRATLLPFTRSSALPRRRIVSRCVLIVLLRCAS